MTISRSPDRLTFQKEGYVKRCEKEGKLPDPAYIEMYKNEKTRYDTRFEDPMTRKNSLEYDLLSTEWILEKVRNNYSYAQNLYAAICNNEFQKLEVVPILTEAIWSCTWRYAGGIVSDMRQEGDYIDWYCSGIRGGMSYDDEISADFVAEGTITDEIRNDFKQLGWIPLPSN